MKVNEIFYSLQGEGARAGIASIFIRLSGCRVEHLCKSKSVVCDTNFASFSEMNTTKILQHIKQYPCKNIIWTGGEPLEQLSTDIIELFTTQGYYQSVETSGLFACPKGIDYITISPKVSEDIMQKNFIHVNELRYIIKKGDKYPEPKITADVYLLSPHCFEKSADMETIAYVVDMCKKNAFWRLSLQIHKFINIQ